MKTTTFIKPRFAISALPGTGELRVEVKAAEKPAPRALQSTAAPAPTAC